MKWDKPYCQKLFPIILKILVRIFLVMYPKGGNYNSLGKKQRRFSFMVALLLLYAYSQGFEVSLGDASRMDCKGHKTGSYHYLRLAIDLNLFLNRIYLTETKHHQRLGEFWKLLGGTHGGDFKSPDGNHYSFAE